MNARRVLSKTFLILVLIFVAVQFIPVPRSNPSSTAPFDESPEVLEIFQRSCFDCHSNETIWPWYSYIAPVSWLVTHDVSEGRRHLNFSIWQSYSAKDLPVLRREIWKQVQEGEMPLDIYLLLHSGAKLSEAEKALISKWSGH